MKYQEVLNYLYSQLPMFQRIGAAAYKVDLKNIETLCEKLQHPEKKLKFIHIAGTNGKGSVSNMLAAIFQLNGYKTGLFTSPHLLDFRERIRIDGKMISKQYVTKFVSKYKDLFDEIKPSFFEWTTILAFQYFFEKKVDIVILETGMGGRLDSTNVVYPELSIITNISEDHKQFLGNTLQKIAVEKAGIIKTSVPVLISEYQKEVYRVFKETAEQKQAPLIYSKNIVSILNYKNNFKFLDICYKLNYIYLKNILYNSKLKIRDIIQKKLDKSKKNEFCLKSALTASYQTKNIQCVLAACEIMNLKGWQLRRRLIHKAIQNTPQITGFRGRWEIVQTHPWIILDIAHNKQGIYVALQHLKNYKYNTLRIIFGMVSDKETDDILKLLPKKATYYITQPSVPRALPVDILIEKVKKLKINADKYPSVKEALVVAQREARKNDLILIFGSAFIVADALAYLKNTNKI